MGPDKWGHLVAGLWIAAASGLFTKRWYVGVGAALLAGAGKEYVDSLGYGTPEFMDFVATGAGGVFGGWIAYGLNKVDITGSKGSVSK